MSTLYGGQPGNVIPPAPIPIAASTDTTPIHVLCGNPHNLVGGERVNNYGHAVNTAANGTWTVDVVDNVTLSLRGSAGTGVGVATGFVQPLVPGAVLPEPSDGDDEAAASVDVAISTLSDRTAFLISNMGGYRFFQRQLTQTDDAVQTGSGALNSTWATLNLNGGSANAWQQVAVLNGLANGAFQAGDVIEVDVSGSVAWTSTVGGHVLALGLFYLQSDAGVSFSGTPVKLTGSGQQMPALAAAAGVAPFRLQGFLTNPNRNFEVILQALCSTAAVGAVLTFVGDWSMKLTVWRKTDMGGVTNIW